MIVYPPMAEVSKDEPIEERLKKLIVRIDELSQDASKKTSQHFGRASSKFNNLMEEMSEDLRRRQDNLKERKETKKKNHVSPLHPAPLMVIGHLLGIQPSAALV